MTEKIANEYIPEVVSPPGETLAEVLGDRGMSQAELAQRMGRPKKTISEIVNGKAELTPETAIQLERVLGVPAAFWNNFESNYRGYVARVAEEAQLAAQAAWPDRFPLSEMCNHRWITRQSDVTGRVRELLSFFAVSSVDQWRERYRAPLAAYRLPKKFTPDVHALSAWLRQGEREAQAVESQPFDAAAFRKALKEIRTLTLEPPNVFQPRVEARGAECGVAIVFIPEVDKSRACGAARWLTPQKALIQLSLRYRTADHLWFTLFHEAGHILLHGKRESFVEFERASTGKDDEEEDANRFAADQLIPRTAFDEFVDSGSFTRDSIGAFADEVGVAPGIVVGRLQHEGHVPFNQLNGLKVRLRWSDAGNA
jgi:addiction module HigA family antidote